MGTPIGGAGYRRARSNGTTPCKEAEQGQRPRCGGGRDVFHPKYQEYVSFSLFLLFFLSSPSECAPVPSLSYFSNILVLMGSWIRGEAACRGKLF